MKTWAKIGLIIAVLMALDAVGIHTLSRQLSEATNRHDQLARKHSKLTEAAKKLSKDLQAASQQQTTGMALALPPGDGVKFIPIKQEALLKFRFQILGKNDQLSQDCIDLLGLTDNEAAKTGGIVHKLGDQLRDHDRASIRQIGPEELSNHEQLQFPANLKSYPNEVGKATYYQIPALPNDQRLALLDSFRKNLSAVIGEERAGVIVQKLPESMEFRWLRGGMHHQSFFFFDSQKLDGKVTHTQFWYNIETDTGNASVGDGDSNNKIPRGWEYLFEDKSAVTSTAPAASP